MEAQIHDRTWVFDPGVRATGSVSFCGVYRLRSHARAPHHPNCFTVPTCYVSPTPRTQSSPYALSDGTSTGHGEVSIRRDLVVDFSKNTSVDQAVLEVRIDASAGRGDDWAVGHISFFYEVKVGLKPVPGSLGPFWARKCVVCVCGVVSLSGTLRCAMCVPLGQLDAATQAFLPSRSSGCPCFGQPSFRRRRSPRRNG